MNYADIIWKLVERLLDEKDSKIEIDDQSNEKQAEDWYITNQKEIVTCCYYLFFKFYL